MGEIVYALGNVATKQAIVLGKAHLNEILEFYERALIHFESALCVNYDSAAGLAKTRYKLVAHNIRSNSYQLARYEKHREISVELLTRLTVSTLTEL